jgi:hypothetical protein
MVSFCSDSLGTVFVLGFFPLISDALLTFVTICVLKLLFRIYYSQACSGFVASETTEADTICDSEEEESIENGKNLSKTLFHCILDYLHLISFPSCHISLLCHICHILPCYFNFCSIRVREFYDMYSSPLQMRVAGAIVFVFAAPFHFAAINFSEMENYAYF